MQKDDVLKPSPKQSTWLRTTSWNCSSFKFGQNTGEIAFGTTQPRPPEKIIINIPNQYGFRTIRSTGRNNPKLPPIRLSRLAANMLDDLLEGMREHLTTCNTPPIKKQLHPQETLKDILTQ
ncbi:hypothetical protein AVEN_29851-1 [Araneus ventricosus]|uniref:Uncharacterized protein n=1 Tax=Araneus ventricosus TaxID=182803 RepID=A0A4Y2K6E1_ARAVE|nr:hypothetical protein AVEN_29851-1 [Araneus ventricosus]